MTWLRVVCELARRYQLLGRSRTDPARDTDVVCRGVKVCCERTGAASAHARARQVGGRRAHVFAPNSCPVGVRWWHVLCTVASVVADVRMSGMGFVGTQGWVRQQWVRALVAAWIGALVMASVAVPGGASVTALVGALVTASIGGR